MWSLGGHQPVHSVIVGAVYPPPLLVSQQVRLCHQLSPHLSPSLPSRGKCGGEFVTHALQNVLDGGVLPDDRPKMRVVGRSWVAYGLVFRTT